MKRKFKMTFGFLAAYMAIAPVALMAHTGHGVTPASNVLHYIAEWVHGAPVLMLAGMLVMALGIAAYRKARTQD